MRSLRMPSSLLVLALALSLDANAATSNIVKYRNTSIPNATGAAGNATIEARALLGKNAVTDLEVTTGSFDGGPAGMIERMVVKRTSGTQTLTSTHSNLTSAVVSIPLTGLARHDRVDLQAGISGVDGNRIDIVATGETVKLRPDLQVTNLTLPASGRTHLPVAISAVIAERNGDIGARANCVLSVNGVERDRAQGIWVDANGTVSCSFSTAFATTGIHQVTVTAVATSPADWDDANNSASGQIEISGALPFQRYSAFALEAYSTSTSSSTSPVRVSEQITQSKRQEFSFNGYTDALLGWDALTGSVVESTGGVVLNDSSNIAVTRSGYVADWGDGNSTGVTCFYGRDEQTFVTIQGCSMWTRSTNTGYSFTESSINASRNAGVVTYISRGWDATYVGNGGDYYEWNEQWSTGSGQFQPYGETVELTVRLTDGTSTYEATPVIAFTPYTWSYGYGPFCGEHWAGGQACSSFRFEENGRTGTVTVN